MTHIILACANGMGDSEDDRFEECEDELQKLSRSEDKSDKEATRCGA